MHPERVPEVRAVGRGASTRKSSGTPPGCGSCSTVFRGCRWRSTPG